MLTFGSLFSGVGGLDLGLERAGWECKFQIEVDPYCQRVLAKHWPDVPRWADIREVDPNELPRVDLLAGGFPCQDISDAGKRVGINGERSGLWGEYARLVCSLQPRYVLVENVAALLIRGMGRVLGDLAASGYDAEWDCIPAAAVGAPHRRDRVWIVAYAAGRGVGRQSEGDQDARLGLARWGQGLVGATADTTMADPDRQGLAVGQKQDVLGQRTPLERSSWWATEPAVGRVADGIPARVDRLRGLGNAVVPQVAEYIGRRLLEAINVPSA